MFFIKLVVLCFSPQKKRRVLKKKKMNPAKDLPSTETTVDVRKKFYEGLLLQELKTHMNTQREYKNDLIDNWSGDAEADWFAALKEDEVRARKKWEEQKKAKKKEQTQQEDEGDDDE
mgnify:CR=1 FL=1